MFGRLRTVMLTASAVLGGAACGTPSQFGLNAASQSFGQVITYNTQIDILFVIGNTSSMAAKQAQLSQQYYPFIAWLAQTNFDFHVAVTTMDMSPSGAQGAFLGSPVVLSRSTPNLESAFVANVSAGVTGSDLTRGLLSMQTGLSAPLITNQNGNFLRSSALLALIFMSDEDDESVNTPQDYISFLNTLKPAFSFGQQSWIANSIVVPSLTGNCLTFEQFASPGLRYIALSSASNGGVESICGSDLVAASQDIHSRIVSLLTQYHLSRPAVPGSIQVFINGVKIPNDPNNGWTYNPTSQFLTFNGSAVPPANANVQVSYQPTTIITSN